MFVLNNLVEEKILVDFKNSSFFKTSSFNFLSTIQRQLTHTGLLPSACGESLRSRVKTITNYVPFLSFFI